MVRERIKTAVEVKKNLKSEVCHCAEMMGRKGSGLSCAEISLSFQMVKLVSGGFSSLLEYLENKFQYIISIRI